MFPSIRRLYLAGRLDDEGLDKALRLGWITEEEKTDIVNEKNPPVEETPVEPEPVEPTPEEEPETEPGPDEPTEGEGSNE